MPIPDENSIAKVLMKIGLPLLKSAVVSADPPARPDLRIFWSAWSSGIIERTCQKAGAVTYNNRPLMLSFYRRRATES